jgi:hypothetical protein
MPPIKGSKLLCFFPSSVCCSKRRKKGRKPMNKIVIIGALACALLVPVACTWRSNKNQAKGERTVYNPKATATWPAGFCSPLGDPMQSSLADSNAFALCKNGGAKGNSAVWGQVTQYYIRCNMDTLRAGWKWVIYCGPDGRHCDCNLNSMWANPADLTNAAWSAGEHCTINGQGRPGANGCDAW